MDHDTPKHNGREEKALFPVLHEKLIASGECSPGDHPTTAVDVMEDDHLKVAQASAIVFNLLGIASRIRDAASRATLCQIACDQGREIVEVMRLHILKENEVLLPQAQKLCTPQELHAIGLKMARFGGGPSAGCCEKTH
jgi:hemerythrin-like domain-containing protein